MDSRCATCKYSYMETSENQHALFCRHSPPVPFVLLVPNELTRTLQEKMFNVFPACPPDGFGCGQWSQYLKGAEC